MKLASFEAIVRAFAQAQVRYLVAGVLAVNAHGYLRFTQDIDLVIALDRQNILRAFASLAELGYKPLVPIAAEQFANFELRQQWIRDKGMKVLNFFSDQHRETAVDVFVLEPFDFGHEYDAALRGEVAPDLEARFVSITALIAMKEAAGRPRDLDDIQHLRWIVEDRGPDGRDPGQD
jgi:hypothetical protein